MSFKKLTPWFKNVFNIIDSTCYEMGIQLYLIGAQARHFHLAEQGIKPGRGTMDIDFAIMLPDIKVYDKLIETLLKKGFSKAKEAHRIIYDKTVTVVDILPFGKLEEKGTVKFTDRKTELSVIGLKEALAKPDVKNFDKETTVQVTPLEGLIVLKLISYYEKPGRTKDLEDIREILVNYFLLNQNRFYENHLNMLDEFSDNNFTIEAGAWLAGNDIRFILNRNRELKELILNILKREIKTDTGGISSYLYGKGYFSDVDSIKRIFRLMIKGITQ